DSRVEYLTEFAAAEAGGSCVTTADSGNVGEDAARFVTDATRALPPGSTDAAHACAARKLRATANRARSLLACYAASTRQAGPGDDACTATALADYERVFEKVNARGGCASRQDADVVEPLVARYAANAVAALAPVCGDGFTGPGEQCDGRS